MTLVCTVGNSMQFFNLVYLELEEKWTSQKSRQGSDQERRLGSFAQYSLNNRNSSINTVMLQFIQNGKPVKAHSCSYSPSLSRLARIRFVCVFLKIICQKHRFSSWQLAWLYPLVELINGCLVYARPISRACLNYLVGYKAVNITTSEILQFCDARPSLLLRIPLVAVGRRRSERDAQEAGKANRKPYFLLSMADRNTAPDSGRDIADQAKTPTVNASARDLRCIWFGHILIEELRTARQVLLNCVKPKTESIVSDLNDQVANGAISVANDDGNDDEICAISLRGKCTVTSLNSFLVTLRLHILRCCWPVCTKVFTHSVNPCIF